MRSHDFSSDDYVCIVAPHEIILPDWTKCPVVKYLTHTHHPPRLLTFTPVCDAHRPTGVCTALLFLFVSWWAYWIHHIKPI